MIKANIQRGKAIIQVFQIIRQALTLREEKPKDRFRCMKGKKTSPKIITETKDQQIVTKTTTLSIKLDHLMNSNKMKESRLESSSEAPRQNKTFIIIKYLWPKAFRSKSKSR